jgi:hypothetical protein
MLFVAASAVGGVVLTYASAPAAMISSNAFSFARAFAYDVMHIYAFKMAAVFMITTSTLLLYTRVATRWIALVGYACALALLVASGLFDWVLFLFPLWVLLVSAYILIDNLRGATQPAAAGNRQ